MYVTRKPIVIATTQSYARTLNVALTDTDRLNTVNRLTSQAIKTD